MIVIERGGADHHTHNSATATSPSRKSATRVASSGLNPNVSINAVTSLDRRERIGLGLGFGGEFVTTVARQHANLTLPAAAADVQPFRTHRRLAEVSGE